MILSKALISRSSLESTIENMRSAISFSSARASNFAEMNVVFMAGKNLVLMDHSFGVAPPLDPLVNSTPAECSRGKISRALIRICPRSGSLTGVWFRSCVSLSHLWPDWSLFQYFRRINLESNANSAASSKFTNHSMRGTRFASAEKIHDTTSSTLVALTGGRTIDVVVRNNRFAVFPSRILSFTTVIFFSPGFLSLFTRRSMSARFGRAVASSVRAPSPNEYSDPFQSVSESDLV